MSRQGGKMKLNKMTLAAVLAFGVIAGANAGYCEDIQAADNNSELIAACPLSGCHKTTPQTAKCPKCNKKKSDCGCNAPVAKDDCNQCPPIAACPVPSAPTCAVCPGHSDEKKFTQQVYAYPNAIYGNNQVVGERNNALYIGDDSLPGFQGVPVAEAYGTPSCGCNNGNMTGAAAPIPCLNDAPTINGIPVDRNPQHIDGSGCPVQIHTNTSMEATRKTMESFEYSGMTGGAAPIVSAFEDVPDGYWASCDINKLTENNIIAGYPDRTYKPNLPVSRAEMASLAVKGFNLNDDVTCAQNHFKDVPKSHWANKAVSKAVSNGLMAGYPDKTFKPDNPVSRAEAYSIIAKGINCPMSECEAEKIIGQYCDGDKVPGWAKIPTAKVIQNGGIAEFPTGNEIGANRDANRAEIASMLENVRVALGYSSRDVVSDCGCDAKQAYYQSEKTVTVPTLQLTFSDEISAKSATVGDRFSALTIDSVTIDGTEFPAGSRVYGKVLEVVRPTKNCQGALKLSFDRIQNGDCKANLPSQILTAQVNKVKKPNAVARAVEFPFTWVGGVAGNIGRTVGGAIVSASNAVEQVVGGVGVGTGEIFQGQFRAAGRSYLDSGKALVKAPVDLTRTALSGTLGILQYSGDEISYLVDPKGMKVSSINPKEKVTIAFGCTEQ